MSMYISRSKNIFYSIIKIVEYNIRNIIIESFPFTLYLNSSLIKQKVKVSIH